MSTNENASRTADLRDKAAHVGESLRDLGGQVRDAAQEKYNRLSEEAKAFYDQGREAARDWEDGLESYVREKPLKSLLIAAGVGVVLGMLWKRR